MSVYVLTVEEWDAARLWDRVWKLECMVSDEIEANGELHPIGYNRILELIEEAKRCLHNPLTADAEINLIHGIITHRIETERRYEAENRAACVVRRADT
jgi:hypothetical protein